MTVLRGPEPLSRRGYAAVNSAFCPEARGDYINGPPPISELLQNPAPCWKHRGILALWFADIPARLGLLPPKLHPPWPPEPRTLPGLLRGVCFLSEPGPLAGHSPLPFLWRPTMGGWTGPALTGGTVHPTAASFHPGSLSWGLTGRKTMGTSRLVRTPSRVAPGGVFLLVYFCLFQAVGLEDSRPLTAHLPPLPEISRRDVADLLPPQAEGLNPFPFLGIIACGCWFRRVLFAARGPLGTGASQLETSSTEVAEAHPDKAGSA